MTVTTGTGLRAAALAAHAADMELGRQRREEQDKTTREREAQKLKAHLKEALAIDADPTENKWVVDGIAFFAGGNWDHELYLSQPCPTCDGNLISYRIDSLEDVGAALGGYWQRHEHYYEEGGEKAEAQAAHLDAHLALAPAPTEQALLDALRAFIAEQSHFGGQDA